MYKQSYKVINLFGRDGEIRTHDPMHPMHVRYQTAPRPDQSRPILIEKLKQ